VSLSPFFLAAASLPLASSRFRGRRLLLLLLLLPFHSNSPPCFSPHKPRSNRPPFSGLRENNFKTRPQRRKEWERKAGAGKLEGNKKKTRSEFLMLPMPLSFLMPSRQ
jgi:hypothetical protein